MQEVAKLVASDPNSNPEMQLLVRMNKGLLLYAQSDYTGTASPCHSGSPVSVMHCQEKISCVWVGYALNLSPFRVAWIRAGGLAALYYIALIAASYL